MGGEGSSRLPASPPAMREGGGNATRGNGSKGKGGWGGVVPGACLVAGRPRIALIARHPLDAGAPLPALALESLTGFKRRSSPSSSALFILSLSPSPSLPPNLFSRHCTSLRAAQRHPSTTAPTASLTTPHPHNPAPHSPQGPAGRGTPSLPACRWVRRPPAAAGRRQTCVKRRPACLVPLHTTTTQPPFAAKPNAAAPVLFLPPDPHFPPRLKPPPLLQAPAASPASSPLATIRSSSCSAYPTPPVSLRQPPARNTVRTLCPGSRRGGGWGSNRGSPLSGRADGPGRPGVAARAAGLDEDGELARLS